MINTILENSLVSYGFDRVNEWRGEPDVVISTDNQIYRDIQIIGKKIGVGLSFALFALVGDVEVVVRAIFTGIVAAYGYLADRDVRALVLQSEEGMFAAMHGIANSTYAFFMHIFGEAGIRIDVTPVNEHVDPAVTYLRRYL